MEPGLVLLILASVLLSAASQVMLKIGMSTPPVQAALTQGGAPLRTALSIATSPLVVLGLASFGLSAVLWLLVLGKVPLSSAYPFVALGMVLTITAGRFLFDEPVSGFKMLGAGLIVTGVLAVGIST